MGLQSTGEIRMSQINAELGRTSSLLISLDEAENGTYGAINTGSPAYPSATNPASMSEWYSYNHTYANTLTLTTDSVFGGAPFAYITNYSSEPQTITYTWKYHSYAADGTAPYLVTVADNVQRSVGYVSSVQTFTQLGDPSASGQTYEDTFFPYDMFDVSYQSANSSVTIEFNLISASVDNVPSSPDNKTLVGLSPASV